MLKNIANQPTAEELELSRRMGTVDEARRRIIEGGGFFIFQKVIDIPTFRDDLVAFAKNYAPGALSYAGFVKWLQGNNLEKHLDGGSLEKQIKQQEIFYRKFYSKDFRINRKKILVDASRLSAIKAGLETGCVNYAFIKAVPEALSDVEAQMTGAEFAFERLMKPLKKDGFKVWAETGTDRWTKLTLAEFLQRCNPAEPEEFDAEAFTRDWVAEEGRVITNKGAAPKVTAGAVEIIFTSNLVDIPSDQKIINKDGEIVEPDSRSYVSAVTKKVRVLSHEEGIILASQLYKDKSYLALGTWEWRRDIVGHKDVNPVCSVAGAFSHAGEIFFYSDHAGGSDSYYRWRLAL